MSPPGARLAASWLVFVIASSSCTGPQTVDVPSPSPYAAPLAGGSPTPPIYSPPPSDAPGSRDPFESPSRRPPGAPPEPTGDASPDAGPRPSADVAGIRCGDEEEEETKGTTVVTRTTCYRIQGSSMAQLDAQMRKKGPRVRGRHAIAITRWLVRWSYKAKQVAGGCDLVAPSIQTVAVFRFPTWEPDGSVPEATIAEYRAFMQEVRQHEGHHRDLAVQAGVAIRRSLSSLPPAQTCGILGKKADDNFDSVFARYQAKQEAFDRAAGGIGY